MNRVLSQGLCCLFVLLAASAASAEIRSGTLTFTPVAGWMLAEGNSGVDAGVTGGLSIGYNFTPEWSLELSGTLSDAETTEGNLRGRIYTARMEAMRHFAISEDFVTHAALGGGYFGTHIQGVLDSDAAVDYGIGANYFVSDTLSLRFDLRHLLNINTDNKSERLFYNNLLATAGLSWQFYGNKSLEQRSIDSDKDGIVDAYDRCPGTVTGATVDAAGCVQDPHLEEHLRLAQEVSSDGDLDGVPNNVDRCPNSPRNMPVNSLGCPADRDGDGIYDIDDTCPDTPAGSIVNAAGCPLSVNGSPVTIKNSRIGGLGLQLEFNPGEARILPEFESDLAKAANFIKMHPSENFFIDGHTDSVGPDEINVALSIKRAESIRDWLIARHAIAPERLISRGFGEQQPIADNATQEGRKQNRRVMIIPAHRK